MDIGGQSTKAVPRIEIHAGTAATFRCPWPGHCCVNGVSSVLISQGDGACGCQPVTCGLLASRRRRNGVRDGVGASAGVTVRRVGRPLGSSDGRTESFALGNGAGSGNRLMQRMARCRMAQASDGVACWQYRQFARGSREARRACRGQHGGGWGFGIMSVPYGMAFGLSTRS